MGWRYQESEDKGDEENGQRTQASDKAIIEFAAISNNTALSAPTSTEACSTTMPGNSIAQGSQGQPKTAKKASENKSWTADHVEVHLK